MRTLSLVRASSIGLGLILASIVRAAVPGWPAELRGDGVVVRFSGDSEEVEGVIILNGKSHDFDGDVDGNTISGTYETEDDDIVFTLKRDARGEFVFKSGKLARTLRSAGDQAPKDEPASDPDPAANESTQVKPKSPENQMANHTARGAMLYSPRVLKDQQSQLDVATILVPKGWEVQSNFEWRPLHANFVVNRSTVFDPQTGWALQYLPLDKFQCLPSAFQQAVQQNDLLTPSGMELCGTVPNAKQYATDVLLARYRNIPGAKIMSVDDLPRVSRSLRESHAAQIQASAQNGYSHHYDAAKVRIAYTNPNSRMEMEEDIYCFIEITWSDQFNQMAIQNGMPNTQTWTIQPVLVYSFIAPRGQLDQASPVLQTIVSSGQITLRWSVYVNEIARKIREINARDLAAMAATQAQITEIQRASWQEATARHSKVNLNTGIQLTGNQVYADPNNPDGPKYVLDLNYTHYVNDDGSIFSTPDTSATPPGSGWREMKTVYPD